MLNENDCKIFNVISYHESFLSIIEKQQLFVHTHDDLGYNKKIVLLKNKNSNYALLTTSSYFEGFIKWGANGWNNIFLLVKIKKYTDNQFTIYNPSTKTFLTAMNVFDNSGYGKIRFNEINPRNYEFFSLVESSDRVHPELSASLDWIILNLREKADDYSVMYLLEDRMLTIRQKTAILPNIISIISEKCLPILVDSLKNSPLVFQLLRSMYPNDIWLNTAIPNLLLWLEENNREFTALSADLKKQHTFSVKKKQELKECFDFLSKSGNNFHSSSLGQLINSYFRRNVVPSKKACVLATVRNEGVYLLEWVAYYRALGFEEIYIYSNNNSDGSDKLLSSLANANIITWVNNIVAPKTDAQSKAYSHALSIMPEILDYEWTLIIDLDEFISFNKDIFDTFFDFLSWHEHRNVEAIAFNWVYIGSGQKPYWENKPITRRLKYQTGQVNPHIKTIVKTNRVLSSQPHFPRTNERNNLIFYNSNGKPHTFGKSHLPKNMIMAMSNEPDDKYACLYHFFYRSAEEFLWKWSRNRGNYPSSGDDISIALNNKFLKGFLNQYDNISYDATNKLKSCVPDLEKHIEKYLNIPDINIAQNHVIKSFKIRSKKVIEIYKNTLEKDHGDHGKNMLEILNKKCR